MSSSSARGEELSPPQSKEEVVASTDPSPQPMSREDQPKKTKSAKSTDTKTKLGAILATAFHQGNAFQLIAAATPTQIETCFPAVIHDRLTVGCALTPSPDTLQDLLAGPVPNTDQIPKGIENASPDAVRDTVLAGALIGSSEVLEGCLKNGADLTLRDSHGRHILHYLGATGNASLLRKVLRRLEKTHGTRSGGKPKSKTEPTESFAQLLNTQDKLGWTPLTIAIVRGNDEAVEALLAYPELNLDTTLTHSCPPCLPGQTTASGPLQLAAMGGRASLIDRLVERGCEMDQVDSHGRNVFHYAAALSDHDLSLQFLDSVTSLSKFVWNALAEPDNNGRTPLFVAMSNGNLGLSERLLFLLRGHDEEAETFATQHILHKDKFNMTALHLAMMRGHHAMLFRASRLWTTFCGKGDATSLVEGSIMDFLLNDFEDEWILMDLNAFERTVYEVINSMSVTKVEEPLLTMVHHQIAKAVRFCGAQTTLRCFRMAVDMDKRGEYMMASADLKRTVFGVFYKILEDNTPTHIWRTFMLNEKLLSVPNLFSAPLSTKQLTASAPSVPRQTQSVNRHLRAPGFAGPRAGSGARSSSVSGAVGKARRDANSPRVPPMSAHTHTLPLSPPMNTGRRGTVTATTTRPPPAVNRAGNGPSFAMPTKSVVLRGGRVERSNPSTLRSASRTAPPQRGTSAAKPSPTHKASPPSVNQQSSAQFSNVSSTEKMTSRGGMEDSKTEEEEVKPQPSMEEVYVM